MSILQNMHIFNHHLAFLSRSPFCWFLLRDYDKHYFNIRIKSHFSRVYIWWPHIKYAKNHPCLIFNFVHGDKNLTIFVGRRGDFLTAIKAQEDYQRKETFASKHISYFVLVFLFNILLLIKFVKANMYTIHTNILPRLIKNYWITLFRLFH